MLLVAAAERQSSHASFTRLFEINLATDRRFFDAALDRPDGRRKRFGRITHQVRGRDRCLTGSQLDIHLRITVFVSGTTEREHGVATLIKAPGSLPIDFTEATAPLFECKVHFLPWSVNLMGEIQV